MPDSVNVMYIWAAFDTRGHERGAGGGEGGAGGGGQGGLWSCKALQYAIHRCTSYAQAMFDA